MIVQPLGIGLPYFASLPRELYQTGLLDFVEITPETLSRQRDGPAVSVELVPEQVKRAQETCAELPIVVHGVELSIGSAHGCNSAYLQMIDAFQASWPFLWHSEHLGFQTIPGEDGTVLEVGVPLPLSATKEAARLVATRCIAILGRYGVPFLLENPAYYLPELPADPEIGDEIGLMRVITESSGCFQLLDLHNLHCNAVNHGLDPFDAISRMPLNRVVEIHIAGGSWHSGFWMDAHDGRVPERVWELLEYTLPRVPNVAGVVFEMLESHAVRLGAEAIERELLRAQDIWQHFQIA
jgi:uncharacterized protein (UPF0276 family)